MHTTGITKVQALALAQLLHQVRPDWPASSLITHFSDHANHSAPFAHIALAALTRASDPNVLTPLLIWDNGPHWPTAAKATLPAPRPCPDHPEEHAHNCVCCAADILAGDRPRDMAGKHHQPATANEGQTQQAA